MNKTPNTLDIRIYRFINSAMLTIFSRLQYATFASKFSTIILLALLPYFVTAQSHHENILGKWMSNDNNLIVEVYKMGKEFRGKIIWFSDNDDKTQPMLVRLDSKNPDIHLRNRKLIGLEVLKGLYFNEKYNEWQNGLIYDASKGKNWNAKAWLTKEGILNVRGFWHVDWLGQNLSFRRI
jgi:uncharacterized protein (DUF2147 family)